jgi:hypothetical protein
VIGVLMSLDGRQRHNVYRTLFGFDIPLPIHGLIPVPSQPGCLIGYWLPRSLAALIEERYPSSIAGMVIDEISQAIEEKRGDWMLVSRTSSIDELLERLYPR